MPSVPVKVMMNVGNPERAFSFAQIPNAGVGLARLEFIINNMVGIHPQALLQLNRVPADIRAEIDERIAAYGDPREYFVKRVVEGIASIAAAFHPQPVILRMSDFKSNEYANLVAGTLRAARGNPMIGFRGAARYLAPSFRACFDMECRRSAAYARHGPHQPRDHDPVIAYAGRGRRRWSVCSVRTA